MTKPREASRARSKHFRYITETRIQPPACIRAPCRVVTSIFGIFGAFRVLSSSSSTQTVRTTRNGSTILGSVLRLASKRLRMVSAHVSLRYTLQHRYRTRQPPHWRFTSELFAFASKYVLILLSFLLDSYANARVAAHCSREFWLSFTSSFRISLDLASPLSALLRFLLGHVSYMFYYYFHLFCVASDRLYSHVKALGCIQPYFFPPPLVPQFRV